MNKLDNNLVAYYDTLSPVVEAIRGLRTNMRFLNVNKKHKILTVTSSLQAEGKSFISSNLAIVSAQSGQKTLLIDADMRRGNLHKMFDIDAKEGLSDFLIKPESDLGENMFYNTNIDNLSLLPNIKVPPNPSKLLESENLGKIFAIATDRFDMIYVDAPPVLLVTDPVIIAKKTYGVILVVSVNKTLSKSLRRSYKILKGSGSDLLGTVLNKADMSLHYGHYGYGYYYKK